MSILEVNHIKKVYKTRMGGDEVTALSVVLPLPDSPMIATNSPSSTEKFTSESACTCVPPNLVVYIFFKCETFSNSISSPPAIFYCVL